MTRPADVLLEDILESADLIQQYTQELSYEEFSSNIEKQDAVMRRLEIIGEAVKGLPEELRASYPHTPWGDIAGARDILVHEYFRVDLELAWEMVRDDVPALVTDVRRILKDLSSEESSD